MPHRHPTGDLLIGQLQLRQRLDDRRVEVDQAFVDQLHHPAWCSTPFVIEPIWNTESSVVATSMSTLSTPVGAAITSSVSCRRMPSAAPARP